MRRLPCAKVFVTSREENNIKRAFKESSTPTVEIQARNVQADIHDFVGSQVAEFRHFYYGKQLFLSSDAFGH